MNLLAAGERARRRDEGVDLIYCKVGTGSARDCSRSGRLHRGANGAAGDMGHVRVPGRGRSICRCGKTGCLEAVAGGWALVRDARAAIEGGATGALAERVGSRKDADPRRHRPRRRATATPSPSRSCRAGARRRRVVAALVNMFNPSVIVIGGAVASAGELFLAEVRHRVYELSLPLATRDLVIRRARTTPASRCAAASIWRRSSCSR